jgi:predicted enzyme related to lactoylglutathione lyase
VEIRLTSVRVNDQEQALRFYTEVLGFAKKADFGGGEFTMPPTDVTGSTIARLNDTCGNLVQLSQLKRHSR